MWPPAPAAAQTKVPSALWRIAVATAPSLALARRSAGRAGSVQPAAEGRLAAAVVLAQQELDAFGLQAMGVVGLPAGVGEMHDDAQRRRHQDAHRGDRDADLPAQATRESPPEA
ncbi:hypothetical protein GCM10023259_066060 [Thermocatellispora tengchongensis]